MSDQPKIMNTSRMRTIFCRKREREEKNPKIYNIMEDKVWHGIYECSCSVYTRISETIFGCLSSQHEWIPRFSSLCRCCCRKSYESLLTKRNKLRRLYESCTILAHAEYRACLFIPSTIYRYTCICCINFYFYYYIYYYYRYCICCSKQDRSGRLYFYFLKQFDFESQICWITVHNL